MTFVGLSCCILLHISSWVLVFVFKALLSTETRHRLCSFCASVLLVCVCVCVCLLRIIITSCTGCYYAPGCPSFPLTAWLQKLIICLILMMSPCWQHFPTSELWWAKQSPDAPFVQTLPIFVCNLIYLIVLFQGQVVLFRSAAPDTLSPRHSFFHDRNISDCF